ncbi:MAG: phosphatidylglycerophosphatase A [Syntrophobacteraceae bacterium]|nr:phosphatidylglycerophosphatase A [Syntrophobacteraceae bacterium]
MRQAPSIYCVVATVLGVGKAPFAPGTVATLVAGIPCFLLIGRFSWQIQWTIALALFAVGVYFSREAAKEIGHSDPHEVVIDELCGYLIAMAGHPVSFLSIFTGFLLFRAFDIWKPWPICAVDRKLSGGIGIMLDDVLAGIGANILGLIILRLAAG